MGVINTPKLSLHTYLEGEHAGAGSQNVKGGGGLNDNWLILDDAVGNEHNSDGTHKTNIIKGTALVQTGSGKVADDSTLEFNSDMLRVKDGGITGSKLGSSVADGSTVEVASGSLRVKDAGVTGAKLASSVADGSTLEVASGSLRVKDAGIVNAKLARDIPRLKAVFTLAFDSITANTYAKSNGVATTSTSGIVMPRAGYITAVYLVDGAGTVKSHAVNYGATYCNFSAGNRYYGKILAGTPNYVEITNIDTGDSFFADVAGEADGGVGSAPVFVTMEVEFT